MNVEAAGMSGLLQAAAPPQKPFGVTFAVDMTAIDRVILGFHVSTVDDESPARCVQRSSEAFCLQQRVGNGCYRFGGELVPAEPLTSVTCRNRFAFDCATGGVEA